jgi:hypothetical protein
MRTELASRQTALLLLYLGLGLASALIWVRVANLPALPAWHVEMITGQAPAPNQYRPLAPWLAEGLRQLLPRNDVFLTYMLLRALATGLALYFFDRYMRVWFRPAAAAAGALALAAILPFTYLRVVQESDPINLLVFVLAFWAMAEDRDSTLLPLVAIGTLNREATALIPAVYLLARWGQRPAKQVLGRAAALGVAWGAVYFGLLSLYGRRDYYCDVLMWEINVASWGPTVSVVLLFGVLWVVAVIGARQAPILLRRALWLLPPYVALHYVVAMVNEVRLFLPYAPVIIPLSWWWLFPEGLKEPSPRSPSSRKAR